MSEKKKFGETAIGQFLKEKLPGVVDAVGNVFPPAKLLAGLIGNQKEALSPEDQMKMDDLLLQYEKEHTALAIAEEANTTERWSTDMNSDSWLSKNVRPITLLYFLFANTLIIVLAGFGIDFSMAIIGLIETPELVVLGAYFGGRTIEKMWSAKQAS